LAVATGSRDVDVPWAVPSTRGAVALLEPSVLDQGTPALVRFETHRGAASTVAISELPVTLPAGDAARTRAVTVDAEGRAVVLLRSIHGDVLVREGAAPQPVPSLANIFMPALAVDAQGVLVAFSGEVLTRRARIVRVSGGPTEVATSARDGSPLPPPFDTVDMRADVGVGLGVERSMPGWGVLDDSEIQVWDERDSDVPAAGRGVAWTGRRFLVAYARHAEGHWVVRVTPVTCVAPTRAPQR
jgi:hypothetical protein